MRTIVRSLAGTIGVLLASGAGAAAAGGDRCSQETLTVDGASIAAVLCAPAPAGDHATVTETFTRGGQSFARSLDIDVVGGAEVSRAVDDVPLDALGLAKRLHLTVAYRNGTPTLEHVLLLPGAVVLK
jgi:hypothetical protein